MEHNFVAALGKQPVCTHCGARMGTTAECVEVDEDLPPDEEQVDEEQVDEED